MLALTLIQVVQSQPLDVEQTPVAVEGIYFSWSCSTSRTSHACIALKGSAVIHTKDKDDRRIAHVCIIQLLLVLPLGRPDIMSHRLNNILAHIAADYKESCPRVL